MYFCECSIISDCAVQPDVSRNDFENLSTHSSDEGYFGSQEPKVSLEISQDDDFLKDYLNHKPDLHDYSFDFLSSDLSQFQNESILFDQL